MSLLDGMGYDCIACGRAINRGMMTKSGDPPKKCRGCKGWVCPSCLLQNREAGVSDCPRCGGELYYPLFNI